jgi:large subunit ribosomal protein L25
MEKVAITGQIRQVSGKGSARSLRRSGIIPCVIYRQGSSTPIQINRKEILKFVNSSMDEQKLINLTLNDGSSKLALLKEYQADPIKGELLHVDFYEISMTKSLRVKIKITLSGLALGVKRDGGILQRGVDEIDIECMPDVIPSTIHLDVTPLEIGHSIHVRDIKLDPEIKLLTDPDELVATITVPAKIVSLEPSTEVIEPIVLTAKEPKESKQD